MNSCGDFWFWFTRPFAELLGGLALLACALVLIALVAVVLSFRHKKSKA